MYIIKVPVFVIVLSLQGLCLILFLFLLITKALAQQGTLNHSPQMDSLFQHI